MNKSKNTTKRARKIRLKGSLAPRKPKYKFPKGMTEAQAKEHLKNFLIENSDIKIDTPVDRPD